MIKERIEDRKRNLGVCFASGRECLNPVLGYITKVGMRRVMGIPVRFQFFIWFCQEHMEDAVPGRWHKECLDYLKGV